MPDLPIPEQTTPWHGAARRQNLFGSVMPGAGRMLEDLLPLFLASGCGTRSWPVGTDPAQVVTDCWRQFVNTCRKRDMHISLERDGDALSVRAVHICQGFERSAMIYLEDLEWLRSRSRRLYRFALTGVSILERRIGLNAGDWYMTEYVQWLYDTLDYNSGDEDGEREMERAIDEASEIEDGLFRMFAHLRRVSPDRRAGFGKRVKSGSLPAPWKAWGASVLQVAASLGDTRQYFDEDLYDRIYGQEGLIFNDAFWIAWSSGDGLADFLQDRFNYEWEMGYVPPMLVTEIGPGRWFRFSRFKRDARRLEDRFNLFCDVADELHELVNREREL